MILKCDSYQNGYVSIEAKYIHRFYLRKPMTDMFQPQDIQVLYNSILKSHRTYKSAAKKLKAEEITIFYEKESLTKILPLDAVEAGNNACIYYWCDYEDWDLDDEENQSLLDLKERLGEIEAVLRKEFVYRHHQLEREKEQGAFVHDMKLEVVLAYVLKENDPWYRKQEDNFLFQYSPTLFIDDSFPDRVDWNFMERWLGPDLPIRHVPHCRLFHDLIEQSPTPMKHICKISKLKSNFKLDHIFYRTLDWVSDKDWVIIGDGKIKFVKIEY